MLLENTSEAAVGHVETFYLEPLSTILQDVAHIKLKGPVHLKIQHSETVSETVCPLPCATL